MNHTSTDLDVLLQTQDDVSTTLVAQFVEQYYTSLYRLARSILRDHDDAEDAAQETVITAVLQIDRYEPGTNLKAWLFTICVNVSRGMLRKRKVRRKWQRLMQIGHWWKRRPETPEQASTRSDADARLWQAVDKLVEKQRLPVLLRYLHGLSIREIGQVLDLPEGTVRSRLHYAHRRLHGLLMQQEDLT